MAGIESNTPTYFPLEIIQNILFRLPVKSLLRFKSVCRKWNTTISDPKFAQTHLRISKNSSSSSYIRRDQIAPSARLVGFENYEFRQLISAVDHPPLEAPYCRLLCHCDGLYLITYSVGRGDEYALWNPSCRSCKNLDQYSFPYELVCGICYDPLLEDYKVVMADAKHYAVFYCRRNRWSDLKEMSPNFRIHYGHENGVTSNGSIYWVSFGHEIVYFDGRYEEWKIMRNVGIELRAEAIQLISSGEDLYLFHRYTPSLGIKSDFLFMKKVGDGDEWIELETAVPPVGGGGSVYVLCSHGNKIILSYPGEDYYGIYDVSENSLARVELNSRYVYNGILPYLENMLWH